MISKLSFIKSDDVLPYSNLALEEFLTFHVEESECILYLWQNHNTVVIGKNQNCWKECNLEAIKADKGHLVRRMSGGGAVYHDSGNLNFTFCVKKRNYDVDRQLQVIIEAVSSFGLKAIKTGRNDITIDNRKFSGNAFFQSGEFCYHHGTLLVDTDSKHMAKYLNVSKEKLVSKGVSSVRARVVNLKELCPQITIDQLGHRLYEAFGRVYNLPISNFRWERLEARELHQIEEKYKSWNWIYGRKIPFHMEFKNRFSWGDIQLQLQIEGGVIKDALCYSDSLESEFFTEAASNLKGCVYEREAIKNVILKTAEDNNLDDERIANDICMLVDQQV